MNGTNGFILRGVYGVNGAERLGRAVSSAGDVNGDGFDDVIVASYGGGNNPSKGESCFVVFGKNSGFANELKTTDLNGTNGFRIDAIAPLDLLRADIGSAGDINGDGFDDMLIGAPLADVDGKSSGSAYVIFGKASGFDPVISLSNLNGSNGFTINGLAIGDQLGGGQSAMQGILITMVSQIY